MLASEQVTLFGDPEAPLEVPGGRFVPWLAWLRSERDRLRASPHWADVWIEANGRGDVAIGAQAAPDAPWKHPEPCDA